MQNSFSWRSLWLKGLAAETWSLGTGLSVEKKGLGSKSLSWQKVSRLKDLSLVSRLKKASWVGLLALAVEQRCKRPPPPFFPHLSILLHNKKMLSSGKQWCLLVLGCRQNTFPCAMPTDSYPKNVQIPTLTVVRLAALHTTVAAPLIDCSVSSQYTHVNSIYVWVRYLTEPTVSAICDVSGQTFTGKVTNGRVALIIFWRRPFQTIN